MLNFEDSMKRFALETAKTMDFLATATVNTNKKLIRLRKKHNSLAFFVIGGLTYVGYKIVQLENKISELQNGSDK